MHINNIIDRNISSNTHASIVYLITIGLGKTVNEFWEEYGELILEKT